MKNPWYKVPSLKKELGMSDERYRQILKSFGLSSSKEISDYDQTIAIMNAMRGKKTITKSKVVIKSFSTPSVPWKWFDATPEQWARAGLMIGEYEKKGISLVAVWGADGSKKFKMRKMR